MRMNTLIVLTSTDAFEADGETRDTGFFWEEMAVPYWRLRDAGHDVHFASIEGGKPPADPTSEPGDGNPEAVIRFHAEPDAMAALENSAPIGEVAPAGYDLIYLPGGHGTMWDLRQSRTLGAILTTAFARGAVLGAVCHGPAGLLAATAPDGRPLVAGRRVTGFTDAEERSVGLDKTVPYLLESALREQGAEFSAAPEPFGAHAVRDGRIVTGQNPASSTLIADLMLEALEERAAA